MVDSLKDSLPLTMASHLQFTSKGLCYRVRVCIAWGKARGPSLSPKANEYETQNVLYTKYNHFFQADSLM